MLLAAFSLLRFSCFPDCRWVTFPRYLSFFFFLWGAQIGSFASSRCPLLPLHLASRIRNVL